MFILNIQLENKVIRMLNFHIFTYFDSELWE